MLLKQWSEGKGGGGLWHIHMMQFCGVCCSSRGGCGEGVLGRCLGVVSRFHSFPVVVMQDTQHAGHHCIQGTDLLVYLARAFKRLGPGNLCDRKCLIEDDGD